MGCNRPLAPGIRMFVAVVILGFAGAAPAGAITVETAPGRMLIGVASARAKLDAGLALPAGGALLAGSVENSGRVYVTKVNSTGALDPSFGSEGVTTVDAQLAFEQILVQPDGRILLVGRHSPKGFVGPLPWGERHLLLSVVRLNPDGSVDSSYGTGGTAQPGIEGGCQCEHVAVLGADGNLTLTGQQEAKVAHPWGTQTTHRWALARLTSSGTLDAGFGTGGIALLPGEDGVGLSLEAAPSGTLIAQGQQEVSEKDPHGGVSSGPANLMTRITGAGAVDPSYAGGKPFKLPVYSIDDSYGQTPYPLPAVTEPDGRVLIETFPVPPNPGRPKADYGGIGLVGYDASGKLDTSFGHKCCLDFEERPEPSGSILVPDGDGSILAIHARGVRTPERERIFRGRRPDSARELAEPPPAGGVLEAEHITTGGAFDVAFAQPPGRPATVAFGGGDGEELPARGNPLGEVTTALWHDGFEGGIALRLANGSLLLAGNVSLSPPAVGGPRTVVRRFAEAVLTPSFTLDPSVGGAAATPHVTLAAPRAYRPAQTRHLVRVPFLVSASAPGLARVELLAGRHLVARRIVAVTGPALDPLQVQLPQSGRSFLRAHRRAPLRATLEFRDLFGDAASASVPVRVL